VRMIRAIEILESAGPPLRMAGSAHRSRSGSRCDRPTA
jgi:hypothetical protein